MAMIELIEQDDRIEGLRGGKRLEDLLLYIDDKVS